MPFAFTHEEYVDAHFVYGSCKGDGRATVKEYQQPSQIAKFHIKTCFKMCREG
jgi:hypothetical protein